VAQSVYPMDSRGEARKRVPICPGRMRSAPQQYFWSPSRHCGSVARVCATHLAEVGVSRYRGTLASTQLKVTGIELFSAGDFAGAEGGETLVLRDQHRGIYKRLVIRNIPCVARCFTATPVTVRGTPNSSPPGVNSRRCAIACCLAGPSHKR
jgi:hypothetical protein